MVKSGSESVKAGEPPVHGRCASTVVAFGDNQAALRRLSRTPPRVQFKLQVGATNDPLEAEADQVADRVMRMTDSAFAACDSARVVRRMCSDCKKEEEKQPDVQRKPSGVGDYGGPASESVHQVLGSPGKPLTASDRAFFEPRLGADLSAVRIDDDDHAAESARSIGARAYTFGSHVAFAGPMEASSNSGRRLLAHELAHVAQKGAAPPAARRAQARIQRDPDPAPGIPTLDAQYEAALANARQTENWQ
jgi:hypothetical protein